MRIPYLENLSHRAKNLIIIYLICTLAFTFHHKYINEFPSHIHAWAQADRYALALGFTNNNLNFFKPQTYVLNHEFPGTWNIPSESSVTAVDFPIHDYIPAVIMKITGKYSPWIFRSYILLYAIIGLFFLYKLSYRYTKSFTKSILITVFSAVSPVYVYYQSSFLPTIPSLSNTLIGIYFYYVHLKNKSNKYFTLSILFLTLAVLSRTTFAIPLIAVFCNEFLRLLKKQTKLNLKFYPALLSIVIIVFYQLYNSYLRKEYGSMFLHYILPPENISDSIYIIKSAFNKWSLQYFSAAQYIVLSILIIGAVYFQFKRGKRKTENRNNFLPLLLIWFFGSVLFCFLMLKQFIDHDYYFLDVFFLPVILMCIMLIDKIRIYENKINTNLTVISSVIISLILIIPPIKSQKTRRETGPWDKTQYTINNFQSASDFLDSLHVPESSKILVFDPYAPNIPFILMKRKGYAIMNTTSKNIEESLTWNYDYIVFQNDFFMPGIFSEYPEIISKIKKIGDNGFLSVCVKRKKNIEDISLNTFLGKKNDSLIFEEIINFENKPNKSWTNINSSGKFAFSGQYSGFINSGITYGLTYKSMNNPNLTKGKITVMVSTYIYSQLHPDCDIVCSVSEGNNHLYYNSHNLKNIFTDYGSWNKIMISFNLPKIRNNTHELAVYLWNKEKSQFYYDDFKISIYQSK